MQDMSRENGNQEAAFDVSKLTVFCVEVRENEEGATTTQTTTQSLSDIQIAILETQSDPEVIQSDPEMIQSDPNIIKLTELIKSNPTISRAE